MTVSAIHGYTPENATLVGPDETAYQGSLALVNGTTSLVTTALLDVDVTVGPGTAERIYDGPRRLPAILRSGSRCSCRSGSRPGMWSPGRCRVR